MNTPTSIGCLRLELMCQLNLGKLWYITYRPYIEYLCIIVLNNHKFEFACSMLGTREHTIPKVGLMVMNPMPPSAKTNLMQIEAFRTRKPQKRKINNKGNSVCRLLFNCSEFRPCKSCFFFQSMIAYS